MAELFSASAVRVPRAMDGIAVAQEHVDCESLARGGVDVGAERALRRREPLHLIADLVAVGQRFVDRSVGDDDEAGVVVVQEVEPSELRCEAGATAALPLGAVGPHVVVGDQLTAAVEDVDQPHRTVRADQRVVGQFHHRKAPSCCSDRVQFPGGGLLPAPHLVERGAPGLLVDYRRFSGRHEGLLIARRRISFSQVDPPRARNSSQAVMSDERRVT